MLDNPFYASLVTVHRAYAVPIPGGLRFPSDVAPFAGIAEAGAVELAEPALFVGPRPVVPAGYQLEQLGVITQMVCDERPPMSAADIRRLDDHDHDAIRALAALVYPHYFRHRTAELGDYHGIGNLQAMIGERMAVPGYREISAVCTHPDHVGRGLARRLLAFASNAIFDRGEVPFLHVSPQNTRAVELYARNGYRKTRDLPFFSVRP